MEIRVVLIKPTFIRPHEDSINGALQSVGRARCLLFSKLYRHPTSSVPLLVSLSSHVCLA